MTENISEAANLYQAFERDLNLKVPDYIKKLLTINGYDSVNTIAQISENDITEIEDFAKNTLPTIIKKEEFEQHYWIFHQNVESFKIVSGHRKIILLLAEYFTNKTKESSGNDWTKEVETGETSETSGDFNQEIKNISKTLRSQIKRLCDDELWSTYKDKCEQMEYSIRKNPNGTFECLTTCFCKEILILFKEAKTNSGSQPRWLYSSFQKHFKTRHLKVVVVDDKEKNKEIREETNVCFPEESSNSSVIKSEDLSEEENSFTYKQNKTKQYKCSSSQTKRIKNKTSKCTKNKQRRKQQKISNTPLNSAAVNKEQQQLITNFFTF